MMRLWVVILEDRHIDVMVEIWLDGEAAVERAKALAREYDQHNELKEDESDGLTRNMVKSGWVYHATTGDDGAKVRVQVQNTKGPWPQGGIGG